jgi:hypothetical protein
VLLTHILIQISRISLKWRGRPMAENEPEVAGYEWLLEPPTEGHAHIHVEIPEGASLSPEVQAAIDQLIRQLADQKPEVQGLMFFPQKPIPVCPSRTTCSPRTSTPCAKFVTCRIVTG